jgi:shikimate kinase
MIVSIICFAFVIVLLYFLFITSPTGEEKKEKNDKKVVVLHFPLSKNKDDIFKMEKKDVELVKETTRHVKKLHNERVEIFERLNNIVVAEDGYHCIVYSDTSKKDKRVLNK